jgi:2-methylcitrate dehydratase PrpD
MALNDATEQLCQHVARLAWRDVDTPARRAALRFLEDTLGVALVGWRNPFAKPLIRAARAWGRGRESRLIGGAGERWPAASAALINAYLIHCQEYDCVHEAAVVHPMAVIGACLWAHADSRSCSGEALLTAMVAAVDVAATLGMAAKNRLRFFRPAQCGALGATAALAKLHGFDAHGIRNALGICLGQLSGTMQAHREGVPALPMQIAYNARNALASVDLALAGLQAPQDPIEGEFGYLRLFEGEFDLDSACRQLGQGFRIAEVSHKPYPSGRATHGGIAALQRLRERIGDRSIASIELSAPPLIRQLVDRPAEVGMLASYAKLCFPWCAAAVLDHGNVDVDDFEPAALSQANRYASASRVSVVTDANTDPNALGPVTVTAILSDGTVDRQTVSAAPGSPANPLSTEQHDAKFRRNFASRWPHQDPAEAQAWIRQLPELGDASSVLDRFNA